jgi:hypothetical protein
LSRKLLDDLDALLAEPATVPADHRTNRERRAESERKAAVELPDDDDDDDDEPAPVSSRSRQARSRREPPDDDAEPAGFGSKFDKAWAAPLRRTRGPRYDQARGEQLDQFHRREAALRRAQQATPDQDQEDGDDDMLTAEDDQDVAVLRKRVRDLEDERDDEPRTLAKPAAVGYMPAAKTVDHCTPLPITQALALLWPDEPDGTPGIDLDPSASVSGQQILRAGVELRGPEYNEDGLVLDWVEAVQILAAVSRGRRCYSNPPYGRDLDKWVAKMVAASVGSGYAMSVVGLLPARTSTKWFLDMILEHAAAICWVRGRLQFVGSKDAAPFSSVLPLFSDDPVEIQRFALAFGKAPLVKMANSSRAIGRVQILRV